MYVFEAEDSNDMAAKVYASLSNNGVVRSSRNGRVIVFPRPVTMVFNNPLSRCNFTLNRKANPIFHHMEALWMLAGRNDLRFVEMFNSNMSQYSDDGVTFNAAYGYRARKHFGFDQIQGCINFLRDEPDTRQAIVTLWDPVDFIKETKDKACNMLMIFSVNVEGAVDLMVYNRSNDAVYGGVTGANPVHFSFFLQHVAENLNRCVGKLTFVSNNLHVYLDLYDHWHKMDWSTVTHMESEVFRIGAMEEIKHFCSMCIFREYIVYNYDSALLTQVSVPMFNYWVATKVYNDSTRAAHCLSQIRAIDWRTAVAIWESKYELA